MSNRTSLRRDFRWTPGLIIGLVIMGAMILVAIIAPVLLTEQASVLGDRAQPPSFAHPLGTDSAGHDMLARSLVATRLTLIMTAAATILSVIIGVLLGSCIWVAPARIREIALRGIDALVAFPTLLLALVVAAILGAGTVSVVMAIGLAGVPYFARLTANLAGSVARQEFVKTARLMGVPPGRIVTGHLLPNMAEPLLVLTASNFAQALTAISALSFVGLGVQSPAYDFGSLLSNALPSVLSGRPIEAVGPAALIVLTGIAATLIGDGFASAADPRSGPGRATKIVKSSEPSAPIQPAAQVEINNLVIETPGGKRLVNGISLHIDRGEIVGLVGESGSGKSLTALTLARLLPDGLTATAHCIRAGQLDLTGPVSSRDLALTMGLVYQDPGTTFNPALRLGTQLTQVLRTHVGLSRRAAAERMVKMLQTVHLTEPEKRMRQHQHELSGGMRQRAIIASALAVGSDLLIADEPTTALDVTVQAEILRELKRMNIEQGTSMLFISHDLAVVRALCDRVAVMFKGEIVEEIRAQDLTIDKAVHPYTRRLLAATPTVENDIHAVAAQSEDHE